MSEGEKYEALYYQVLAAMSWQVREPQELRRIRYLLDKGAVSRLKSEGLSQWMRAIVARRGVLPAARTNLEFTG